MALEALIARLRGDAATPATPAINEGLQGKPALILGCTPETPATPQKSNTRSFPSVAGVSWRWLIHFPDRNPLEVAFSPEASHAEVLDCYPDALAAEPIEPGRRQPGAPLAGDQETEIRSWLAAIGETDQATIAEVLIGCRQDEDVRRYFLDRTGEIPAGD